MMTREDIKTTIREIVAETFGVEVADVEEVEDSLTFYEMFDESLESVEIAMKIEEVFNLNIPHSDMESVMTVNGAAEYVEKKIPDAANWKPPIPSSSEGLLTVGKRLLLKSLRIKK